jgi:hypothetical protein
VEHVQGIPLVFIGGSWGYCLRSSAALVPVGIQDRERQADALALTYMTSAGYDPRGLVNAFQRVTGKLAIDSTIAVQAGTPPDSDSILNTSEFDRVKALLVRPPVRRRAPSLN